MRFFNTSTILFMFAMLGFIQATANDELDIPQRRGDANDNGLVDLNDSLYINNYLFNNGPAPSCMDAADANDDGAVNISDSSYIVNWIYFGGPAPPDPGPTNCGEDPTADSLTCSSSACEE